MWQLVNHWPLAVDLINDIICLVATIEQAAIQKTKEGRHFYSHKHFSIYTWTYFISHLQLMYCIYTLRQNRENGPCCTKIKMLLNQYTQGHLLAWNICEKVITIKLINMKHTNQSNEFTSIVNMHTIVCPSGTKLGEIFIEIHLFSFKKIHLKMLSGICFSILSQPQCDNFMICWYYTDKFSLF